MKVKELIRALQATRHQDAEILLEGCDCIGELGGAFERRSGASMVVLLTRKPEAGSVVIGAEAITDKDLTKTPSEAEKAAGF